ncbi:N-acetyltransferase [Ideonella sp. 4Y16]|uniref:N-acetyltransferase n=1 Tax=Ideonella alba TaxID=2824118 RepID=A0A940Y8P5_9BURK|nr:GNAT family N-acetyltransferase [Ideonella alba]MBQ0931972.1 N-acetyltransferase [Ideonella alba]MBQ0942519.1 N-acetyltransferase [Ideonella alba]
MDKDDVDSADYSIEVCADPAAIAADAWNTLLAAQSEPTPFMRHEFLLALHAGGCAAAATGWAPRFVLLRRQGRLVAAAPAWLKAHSWGEYVFDWAWAQAYQRHALPYYPKLVVAVPFTPVRGSRLLAEDGAARQALLAALQALARQEDASGVHLLFGDAVDQTAAGAARWLPRHGVQFHWQNRPGEGWPDWPAYLADLKRDKRKKIQQEQRRVAQAGVALQVLEGPAIRDEDWAFFHRCYTATYLAHGHAPYLDEAFFQRVGRTLPAHWLMVVATQGEARIAASLLAIDRARGIAWGRHWGALAQVPCLHFDACYYRPLEWCIDQGFQRFEGGAQGEHKMARGLLPEPTGSAHWIAHTGFAEAIADHLGREGRGIEAYLDELGEHSPFKAAPA